MFIALGRGTVMCNWTRTPIVEWKENYWHLLEVADLRFDFFFFLQARNTQNVRKHAVSFSAHPSSLRYLSFLWLAEVWHHFWLVADTFRPVPFYLNVWCKCILNQLWMAAHWICSVCAQRKIYCQDFSCFWGKLYFDYWKINWYRSSLPCIFANICWLDKFDHHNVFGPFECR